MTLTPPPVFWYWESFCSLTKKCPWWWYSVLRYTNVTFETWPCDLCVNNYSTYIYIYINVCICICICINVNVCHVCIVCHVYIYTCVCLIRVDLDIILLVGSDGDDSAKGWKPLFENVGVFEVHELHDFLLILSMKPWSQWRPKGPWEKNAFWREKIVTLNQREFDLYHSKGVTIGREREWELPKRNDSRNHSRKYSWELWEVTSLIFLPLMGGHHSLGATFLGS